MPKHFDLSAHPVPSTSELEAGNLKLFGSAGDLSRNFRPKDVKPASIVVAPLDAPDSWKAVADYICDQTNDETELNNAAADVQGTERELILAPGEFFTSGVVDFLQVKYLFGFGIIRSDLTSGDFAQIGTQSNANTDLEHGFIKLHVEKRNATVNAGTTGIRMYGAADCDFHLSAKFAETGLNITPDNSVGIAQYVAFNRIQFRNFGDGVSGTTAIRFNSVNSSFINENTFIGVKSGSAETGIAASSGQFDNNLFLHPDLEDATTPINLQQGGMNRFLQCRLEQAGSIEFGDNAFLNYVQAAYNYDGTTRSLVHEVTDDSYYPNFVVGPMGIQWRDLGSIHPSDWLQTTASTTNDFELNLEGVEGKTSGFNHFDGVSVSSDTWKVNSSDGVLFFIPVEKGDLILFHWKGPGSARPNITAMTDKTTEAPTLTSSDIPYFGTGQNSRSLGTTDTGTSMNLANYPLERLVSVNRSDVNFMRVDTEGFTYNHLSVKLSTRRRGGRSIPALNQRSKLVQYGSGAPSSKADAPGAVYWDYSTTPPTRYEAYNYNTWIKTDDGTSVAV